MARCPGLVCFWFLYEAPDEPPQRSVFIQVEPAANLVELHIRSVKVRQPGSPIPDAFPEIAELVCTFYHGGKAVAIFQIPRADAGYTLSFRLFFSDPYAFWLRNIGRIRKCLGPFSFFTRCSFLLNGQGRQYHFCFVFGCPVVYDCQKYLSRILFALFRSSTR